MSAVPLREARQAVVRDRVLDGVADLLANGQDLTYAKVAEAADVPERTVYRYFPTRQDLMAAVVAWVNERTGTPRGTTRDEAIELVRQLFPTLDEMAPVVREVLTAPEGLAARLDDNDERRAAALAVVDHEAPGLDRATAERVAAVVQLLTSATAWQSLHDYWDLDGAEAAESVAVALTFLLAGASASTTGAPR
jgi:AcrR family transcriptional regulator